MVGEVEEVSGSELDQWIIRTHKGRQPVAEIRVDDMAYQARIHPVLAPVGALNHVCQQIDGVKLH